MTRNYYGGNHVTVGGHNNTGMVNNYAPQADREEILREMLAAATVLREHVPPKERAIIDQSVRAIESGGHGQRQGFRRALGNIAGIATVVGEVGAPVVEAVRKVMTAFGLI